MPSKLCIGASPVDASFGHLLLGPVVADAVAATPPWLTLWIRATPRSRWVEVLGCELYSRRLSTVSKLSVSAGTTSGSLIDGVGHFDFLASLVPGAVSVRLVGDGGGSTRGAWPTR